jgi:AraC family transcriptional regulator
MNAWPQMRTDPMDRARRHIEQNLAVELSLTEVADAAGLSPYHFSRQFTARFGFSPMAYVRARRLEMAAERLRGGPRTRLIDLALDCGFDSQEGFTRAFTRTFGVSPGRYRAGARPPRGEAVVRRTAHLPPINLIQAPTPARKPPMRLIGPADDFDEAAMPTIPALWRRFEPHLPLPGQTGGGTFGVLSATRSGDGVHYVATVAVGPEAPVPAGFEAVDLPARAYLIFRQVLDGGPLNPQMHAAGREIWGERLPLSGRTLVRAPDLEVYPEGFNLGRPGAWVEWWIPVEG